MQISTTHKDVDWQIFLELSDKDIVALCQTTKQMALLCQNEDFWKLRFAWIFPDSPLANPAFIPTKSWKELYKEEVAKLHVWTAPGGLGLVYNIKALSPIGHTRERIEPKVGDIVEIGKKKSKNTYIITKIDTAKNVHISWIATHPTLAVPHSFYINIPKIGSKITSEEYQQYFASFIKQPLTIRFI